MAGKKKLSELVNSQAWFSNLTIVMSGKYISPSFIKKTWIKTPKTSYNCNCTDKGL